MNIFSKIISLLGITYDAAENIRETKTDVEDNKSKERHYDFDDGTGYKAEDFLKTRKIKKPESKKEKKNAKESKEHEL